MHNKFQHGFYTRMLLQKFSDFIKKSLNNKRFFFNLTNAFDSIDPFFLLENSVVLVLDVQRQTECNIISRIVKKLLLLVAIHETHARYHLGYLKDPS